MDTTIEQRVVVVFDVYGAGPTDYTTTIKLTSPFRSSEDADSVRLVEELVTEKMNESLSVGKAEFSFDQDFDGLAEGKVDYNALRAAGSEALDAFVTTAKLDCTISGRVKGVRHQPHQRPRIYQCVIAVFPRYSNDPLDLEVYSTSPVGSASEDDVEVLLRDIVRTHAGIADFVFSDEEKTGKCGPSPWHMLSAARKYVPSHMVGMDLAGWFVDFE